MKKILAAVAMVVALVACQTTDPTPALNAVSAVQQGIDGIPGERGPVGPKGPEGPLGLRLDLQALQVLQVQPEDLGQPASKDLQAPADNPHSSTFRRSCSRRRESTTCFSSRRTGSWWRTPAHSARSSRTKPQRGP